MRDADYGLNGCEASIPLADNNMASPALTEEEIGSEDLRLIDSFAALPKAKRRLVLDIVGRGLREKLPFMPE